MAIIPKIRVGIGEDSHRFLPEDSSKICFIGGILFDQVPGFSSDSDGDVIFHAICHAITSLTGTPILGGLAQDLLRKDGITDSSVYVQKGLEILVPQKIQHVALSLEGKRPKLLGKLEEIRSHVAHVLQLDLSQVGISVTSGHGLNDVGCGDGLKCLCVLTTIEP